MTFNVLWLQPSACERHYQRIANAVETVGGDPDAAVNDRLPSRVVRGRASAPFVQSPERAA
ncbi:MAG: hypothetical protein RLZ81_3056 [Pseudomonadota bacterium]|jgi:hypothetical protein